MKRKSEPIITVLVILIIISLLSYSNRYPFLQFLRPYIKYIWIGLVAIIVIAAIILSMPSIFGSRKEKEALEQHPNFLEEMQDILRATLTPLGFDEKEGMGWANRTKFVTFTRDEFTVSLWLDVLDSIYHVDMSSKSELVNNEKRPVVDYSIECSSLKKADEFKSDSIAKLNEWMIEKRVR